MKITMPEEFHKHEYEIRDFIPKSVHDKIMRARHDEDMVKASDELIIGMVLNPKFTEACLQKTEIDGTEMEFLTLLIMEKFGLTEARIEELKKKATIS